MRFNLSFFFLLLASVAQAATFPITQYGAVPDGKTVNTRAINEAIRACHAAGGGTVLVPTGTFITGTVRLLSNVNFHLEAGAILRGSPSIADYERDASGELHGMFFTFEARNVSLTGEGEIDGNCMAFYFADRSSYGKRGLGFERQYTRQGTAYMPEGQFFSDGPITYDQRPGMMVHFQRCERVTVRDLLSRNTPEWTFYIGYCDNVLVQGITVRTNLMIPNADGVHCTSSRNVRIADCDISSGDDAVVVTGFTFFETTPDRQMGNRTGVAENVVVSNCILQSRSAGIRVGYGTNPIRNCTFSNIVIHDSNRGIGVFSRDGAPIENILFQNITIQTRLHNGHWWGKAEPIHVSAIRQKADVPAGPVRNVRFEQVEARGQSGMVLWGEPESPLENITLSHVRFRLEDGPLQADWGGNFDLRPSYPAPKMLFKHDMPGLYAQHTPGLLISNFALEWSQTKPAFFSHGLELVNVTDARIESFQGNGATSTAKPILMTNCRNVMVK